MLIDPPDENRTFNLEAVEVSTRDRTVYKLLIDLDVLYDLTTSLPKDDQRAHQALYTANHIINTIIKGNYRLCALSITLGNPHYMYGLGSSNSLWIIIF